MKQWRAVAFLLWAAAFGCGEAAPERVTTPGPAAPRPVARSGEVVRTWNELACAQEPTNPVKLSRTLAMMHAAMHDAVNGVTPRYERYAAAIADPAADPEAAAAAAAHRVLMAEFPANQAAFDDALARTLAAGADGPAERAGVALGDAVGRTILDTRATDHMTDLDPFSRPAGPGVWEPTPPAFEPMIEPQIQNVTPFVIKARDQFALAPPPALNSPMYTRDFNEVMRQGRDTSRERTPDQTHSALFWFEPSPIGWSRMANVLAAAKRYDLHETARLQALVNMAMADGFIAGFYYKRFYALWRPVTGIQRAELDGNPQTEADPTWLPLRPTARAPDYPSTHSVLGAAAAEVMLALSGVNQRVCMTSKSAEPPGSTRCWDTFEQASLENADSRVHIGFHFRFASVAGVQLGRAIGRHVAQRGLRPLRAAR